MAYPLYILAAIAVGAALSFQPPINSAMAGRLDSTLLAAAISVAISLALVVAIWLTLGKGHGDLSQVRSLPWWVALGGLIGVFFVVGGVMIAPVLGVALFFVCIVGGQLLGATLADHVGAFGVQQQPVNALKLLGLGLVLAGAALVESSG